MKNLSNTKLVLIILAVFALLFASVLFWVGIAVSMGDSNTSSSSRSTASSVSVEDEYLDAMDIALERPHTFASDSVAIEYGYAVCELLDTYYIEDLAPVIERDRSGDMRGVDLETKSAGLYAAVYTLCPEHFDEVYEWTMN